MTVKTENHILSISFMIMFIISFWQSLLKLLSFKYNTRIKGLGGGGAALHPRILKLTTISGGNDSDLPKVCRSMLCQTLG